MPASARRARLGRADGRSGQPFDIKPAGMLALDVARVEAGLLLIDVDFFSSKKAMIDAQKYTPYEMGLGRLVVAGQGALRRPAARSQEEHRRGPARQVVGLELDWTDVEQFYEQVGLPPTVGATASRVAVPVYRGGRQVGRATTTTWSPVLKKMIALATVDRPHYAHGTRCSSKSRSKRATSRRRNRRRRRRSSIRARQKSPTPPL